MGVRGFGRHRSAVTLLLWLLLFLSIAAVGIAAPLQTSAEHGHQLTLHLDVDVDLVEDFPVTVPDAAVAAAVVAA